jgi:AcrR family transcriptional regulator
MTKTTSAKRGGEAPSDTDQALGEEEQIGTRERILDIALELFTTQGYEGTSLRQIAERLGFSKAAIYYHFASKEDIFEALHLRMHDFSREMLSSFDTADMSPKNWASLLDRIVDQIIEARAMFALHERNQAVVKKLHSDSHHDAHDDLEGLLRSLFSNPDIPLSQRVRLACATGAVIGTIVLAGDAFAEVPSEELGEMLRSAIRDLVAPLESNC